MLTFVYEFLGQIVQSISPSVLEYVPVVQFVQDAVPDTFLCLPAIHATQGPPMGPDSPFGHSIWHWLKLVAATGEVTPSGQLRHGTEPVEFLYVPGLQAVHGISPL